MEFSVNGDVWGIAFVPPYSDYLWMGDRFTVGVTDRSDHMIYLSDGLYGNFLRAVLSHEICHAIMASYDIDMDIPDEECVCQIMENYGDEVSKLTEEIMENLN